MNRVFKITVVIFCLGVVVYTSVFVYRVFNPTDFIYSSSSSFLKEDASFYMDLYRQTLNEERFDEIILNLLDKGNDVRMLNFISGYCVKNKICHPLHSLKTKVDTIRSFPVDTVWYVYLGNSYTRGSNVEMASGKGNLIDNTRRLEIICEE